jgi:PAS domain-containing protein
VLGLQILGLLAATAVLGVGVWLVGERPRETLVTALSVVVPVILAVAFLLYRQNRARRATQRALQIMQARASGFFESAMDPIISIDESQRIVPFNAAAERAFRWSRRQVLGQPVDMLIPQRFHAAHRARVEM